MSRTSRLEQKFDINNEVLRDIDGTAARTRPFSFEEIMLRRKNNKLNADAKGGEVSEKDNGENVSNYSKADKGHEDDRKHDSEGTLKGSSTKKQEGATPKEKSQEDIMKFASEYTMEGSSSKKQEGDTPKEKGLKNVMKHISEDTMKGSSSKKQEGVTPKEKGLKDVMKHISEDTMKGNSTKKHEGATPKEEGHEDIMKHASEDTMKGSSSKKQQGATPKEKGHRDVMKHASEDTMKVSSTKKQEGATSKEKCQDYAMKHASQDTMRRSSISKQEGATSKEKGQDYVMKHASQDTMRRSSTSKQEGATSKEKGQDYVMKHASQDTMRRSSTSKQEGATPKEGNLVKGKSKEITDAGKVSKKDIDENVPKHSKSVKGFEDVMKQALVETMKRSSTKKQDGVTPKEGDLGKGKGKEIRDAEPNLKHKLQKDINSRVRGDRNEKRSHRRSRNEERSMDDTEADKKRSENSVGKEKYIDTEVDKKHSENSVGKEKYLDTEVDKKRSENSVGKKRYLDTEADKKRSENSVGKERYLDTEADKKRSENSVGKEKYLDKKIGKSERESKRKHWSRDGENNRDETEEKAVKKRDSGRWQDLELAERKSRKKDSSLSHHEEARPKRRRSRSPETRDRDRRSISLSPRAHGHTSHNGQEYGESSLNSLKERKQYSDVDRGKLPTNGGYTNTHYQRHGGRGSRLGGYSPRKRRTEAAVKTPSPTARSPERKSAGWDLPPMATGISSDAPSSAHELPSSVTAPTSAARPQSGAPSSTSSMSKSVSVDSIQLTQTTRPMRILHVEDVPTSASDKSIVDGFNNFFLSSGAYHVQGSPPCISCIVNKEKCRAVVEFLTPEDATTALSFDGRSFLGFILKVRRLKDFNESSTGPMEKPIAAVDSIPDLIKDSPYKIFIGGISKVLSSDMMMEIASAFGTLRAYRFNLSEDMSCAFLEYADHSVTLKACAGLNGMKLGGQILTAVQATPDALLEDNAEVPPFYGIPEHAKPLLLKPTTILKLKNVLNQEELSKLSVPELEEVLEDTRLECARFGTVKAINIVKYDSTSATVPEALEVTDQADVRPASQSAAEENYIENSKSMAGSGENSRLEAEQDVQEPLVDVGNAEDNKPVHHDEHEEDHMKPSEISSVPHDNSTCHMDTDTDTNHQEPFNHHDTTKEQSAHHGDKDADIIPLNDSSGGSTSKVEESLKTEETNCELQESLIEVNDIAKKDSTVFEYGCIFVEYARTEASSAAAHCLHGRLYGDRVVEVGYVDRDLYISRFPK